MENLVLAVKDCCNSKIIVQLQQEILFYAVAKTLWKKIFQFAYDNCEGCLFPHTVKHSCVFLWNTLYLKQNKLVERFIENFYNSSFCQLDWNKDFSFESQVKQHIDERIFKECYWQTRQRKEYLQKYVTEYIMAIAFEEDDNLICQKLKEITCNKLEDNK